ncbi:MAG: alpha-galactosidase [Ignavibacteriaceae bacterium]
MKKIIYQICFAALLGLFSACADSYQEPEISSDIFTIKYDSLMHSFVDSKLPGSEGLMDKYFPSEVIYIGDEAISDFKLETIDLDKSDSVQTLILTGTSTGEGVNLKKEIRTAIYSEFPSMAFVNVTYTNSGKEDLNVTGWVNNSYTISSGSGSGNKFWSYQGASFPDRRDWVMPLTDGFSQENYMGMNASDYGNGTPIADVWRKDIGMAIGHAEVTPKLVSLPVEVNSLSEGADVKVMYKKEKTLHPGESIKTYETFINIHKGDYYATLKNFRNVMAKKGLVIQEAPAGSYEAAWCAWGYERDFNVKEVLGTLPKVKELGYKWAVLDDGWQTSEGDWYLHPAKFPNGDKDMIAFVNKIKEAGLKAQLWWAPLAVDPGTDLIKEHPDMLLLNKDGSKQDISWWDSYYLCPAYDKTLSYTKDLVIKIMKDWGYEGLKIDGQHLNGVPPCYNPAHKHAYPEESVEKLQDFWKMVIETAQEINKDAVIQICPCGTSYSFYNLPYMNQTVSSDPLSSWQIRLKGKTLKGLMGESASYYGDHVELSDNGTDFATSVGIGAVVGTKFTWPSDRHPQKGYILTKDKEIEWKKWIDIYHQKMLPKGEYLGELYDIGFDVPETHAIKKDSRLYYAFYADKWNGQVELRGLESKTYKVTDYVNNKELGEVKGPVGKLDVEFNKSLLIECIPVK